MNLFNSKLIRRLALTLSCVVLPVVATVHPARSAEQIGVSYSFLSGSVAIASLEPYARTGQVDSKFANYVRAINSKQLAQLQQLLSTKIPLNAVAVSQFLHTPVGEKLLERLGQVIQTDDRASGFPALREAMILAARSPQGFTLLEVLRQFPSKNVYIRLEAALALALEVNQFVNQTRDASMVVNQKATLEAQVPFDISSEDLRQPGKFAFAKQTLTLSDPKRDRQIIADLYLPRSKTRHPVIVISHGLGSDRFSFVYLAEHLASYGFAVVVPEHSGSDANQLAALLAGRVRDIIAPQEFVNRPIDVSKVLDKLEQLSRFDPNLQGRLDLQNVGIVGQSFGGYTALAVAGATLQSQKLKALCQTQEVLNLSLLLQCGATQIPQLPSHLSDPRIKAAIAINPFISAIFGQAGLSQIRVPTMIVASSADTVAPALPEQIQPFTWLTTPNKYLVLMTGATHISTLASSPNEAVPALPFIGGNNRAPVDETNPAPVHEYMKALNTAFFKTHLMNQQQYRSYLSADYAKAIGQLPIPLTLVKTLSSSDLSENLEDRLNLSLRAFCFHLYSLVAVVGIRQAMSKGYRLNLSSLKSILRSLQNYYRY